MLLAIVIFWISVLLIFHSYLLFPVILKQWARNKLDNAEVFSKTDKLPSVSVILSVFNEQKVIEQKIRNIYQNSYPTHLLTVYVGSDGSTDDTNLILSRLEDEFPSLNVCRFDVRRGKCDVINQLAAQAADDYLLFTDAKVLFDSDLIFQLVKHFKNQSVGIVGANISNENIRLDGISFQEKTFMSREMSMKYHEGCACGYAIGVYGACYAIRKSVYSPVPSGFSVDDFYINMQVYRQGYKGIMEMSALCRENVPNHIHEEFKRKVRIAVGNYQNMWVFKSLLLRFNSLSFCYISHKVIRWTGPFLLLAAFVSNLFMLEISVFYRATMFIQLLLLILPIVDFFLQKIRIQNITLRFVTHFYSMNLALLTGFVKYLKGTKSNVWEPTNRQH